VGEEAGWSRCRRLIKQMNKRKDVDKEQKSKKGAMEGDKCAAQ